MNTSFVEELIAAAVAGNNKDLVRILEKFSKEAEGAGKKNVAQRIRNTIRKIPSKTKTFAAQGGSVATQLQINSGSLIQKVESDILIEEVVLEDEQKSIIFELCREWENFDALTRKGLRPLNKLLFYGPPGTGKTRLAHAVANKLDLPLIIVQLDELISSFLGKTGKNIREIFSMAEHQRVVIFLDEIDTLAKHRDDDHELGELKRVVSVLIQNIDAFPNHSVLIGATNHEHLLDKALWRRFDEKIHFGLPGPLAREKLFQLFLKNYKSSISFETLGSLTDGLSGATIAQICEKTKKQAVLDNVPITNSSFAKQILMSLRNQNGKNEVSKKTLYKICQTMKNSGMSVLEISQASGVPYTTLRDNITFV